MRNTLGWRGSLMNIKCGCAKRASLAFTNFYCSNLRKLGHEAWEIDAPGNESPSEPQLLFLTPCSSAHVFWINSLLFEDRLRFPPSLDWFLSKGLPAELSRLAFEPRV